MTLRARIRTGATFISSSTLLSIPVIAVFFLQVFLMSYSYYLATSGQAFGARAVTNVLALISASVVLLIVRWVCIRIGWERVSTWLAITVLVTAVAVRSLVLLVMEKSLAEKVLVQESFVLRWLLAEIATIPVAIGVAAVVGRARARSKLIAQLRAEQQRLRFMLESMDVTIKDSERNLRESTRTLLDPVMDEIRDLLDERLGKADAEAIADQMMNAVRDVVRPVSHQVAVPTPMPLAAVQTLRPVRLNPFRDRMIVPQAIRPGWLFVCSVFVTLPIGILLKPDEQVFLTKTLSGIGIVGLLIVVKMWWPQRFRSMRVAYGFLLILLIFSLGLAVDTYVYVTLFPGDYLIHQGFFGSLVKEIVFVVVTLFAVLQEHSDSAQRELEVVNKELSSLVARMRREMWLSHRTVSLAVHGPLQSMLVATAMRLRSAGSEDVPLHIIQRRLTETLDEISQPRMRSMTVEETLAELQDLWSGAVTITYAISLSATDYLGSISGLQICVSEICREGVSNAIRHGNARNIGITVDARLPGLYIAITDDGGGVSEAFKPGLGTSMLDETCFDWRFSRNATGGTTLQAMVL